MALEVTVAASTAPIPAPGARTAGRAVTLGLGYTVGGAAYGFVAGLSCGVGAIICSPGFAAVGAVVGAVAATADTASRRSPETVEAAQKSIVQALDREAARAVLAENIVTRALQRAGRTLSLDAPAASRRIDTNSGWVESGERSRTARTRGPSAKTAKGPDTILSIEIERIGIHPPPRPDDINPSVGVGMIVTGRITHAGSGALLYTSRWGQLGPRQSYFALGENDGALARQQVRAVADQLAARIVADLFVAPPPAIAAPAIPPSADTARMVRPDDPAPTEDPAAEETLARRLAGAEYRGQVAPGQLEAIGATRAFDMIVRLHEGGAVELQAMGLSTSNWISANATVLGDTGSWTVAGRSVCITMQRADGGRRTCYAASADASGGVTLSGAGLFGGRRFVR